MKRFLKQLYILSLVLCIGAATQSCSDDNDEATRRSEYTQIVENKTAIDAMNELYVAADGDTESLARILQVTPSTIARIRSGETNPTPDFEEKYKEVLVYYNINGRSYSKLQSALDDDYSWFDSVLNFPSHHPWWFWGINIGLLALIMVVPMFSILTILLEILVFLVAWVTFLFYTPDQIEDKYVDTLNPAVEQML